MRFRRVVSSNCNSLGFGRLPLHSLSTCQDLHSSKLTISISNLQHCAVLTEGKGSFHWLFLQGPVLQSLFSLWRKKALSCPVAFRTSKSNSIAFFFWRRSEK